VQVPFWIDPLGSLGFMLVLDMAVTGATWMACEGAFHDLIVDGKADIIRSLRRLLM